MKAVILAGGRGTRLSEETNLKPKPLVEANGKPLIWHIMQNYSRTGITEFIISHGVQFLAKHQFLEMSYHHPGNQKL